MGSRSLQELADRYGIRLIVRFGSTVTARVHPGSDLDLAVLLETFPSSLDEELDLRADLQSLYPGQELDLAILNRADPLFMKKIAENCELLYGHPRDLAELKMLAFRRYQDHRRYLALERDYVRRAIRSAS